MFRRLSPHLCLGLLSLAPFAPARAAQETNLVEILRAAIAPPRETPPATNKLQTLAAGDVLQLTVYQEDDLNLPRAVIAKDGRISHPLLGAIPVAGRTLEEAQKHVHDILEKDYLVHPRVSLTVLEYAKYRITILREVAQPGIYEVARTEPKTLTEAIGLAGGPTPLGNMSKVTVQRVIGGQKKEYRLDAGTKEGRAFMILPDDVIEVPRKGR
jgi:polysaccharide export outer membrane protein